MGRMGYFSARHSDAKVKGISAPDAELFAEIKEIKKAFKSAEK